MARYTINLLGSAVVSVVDEHANPWREIAPDLSVDQLVRIRRLAQAEPLYQARAADGPGFSYRLYLEELP